MNLKVSVIIPCYNSFEYVNKCFRAFESQSYENFEVIVVDDKSTDDSYDQLMNTIGTVKFDLKVFQNEKNSGPNVAREYGIKYATGDVISFCDCDDWYEHDYLETMVDSMKVTNSNCVLCNYQYVFGDGKKQIINYTDQIKEGEKETTIALAKDTLCVMLIEKEIVESITFPKLYHGEDAALIPTILSKCKRVSTVNNVLYNYYMRSDSASNTFHSKAVYSMIDSFAIVEKSIQSSYPQACEYIGIKNILYSAVMIGVKTRFNKEELITIIDAFLQKYPNFIKNKYLSNLATYKRVFVWFASKKAIWLLKIIAYLHSKFMK